MTDVELVFQLEERSRNHGDRVLRLMGVVGMEPSELLIFRGFSSSTTPPTRFDPDVSVLPDGTVLVRAELLMGPIMPGDEHVLAGPMPPAELLTQASW